LPEPTTSKQGTPEEAQAYYDALANEMLALIESSQGRAFLLFYSNEAMRAVYTRIASQIQELGYPVFCQGQLSQAMTIEGFKAAGNGVLFGLKTYWEGIDVQGEALSLVIVDKMPFTPPSSLEKKRKEKLGNTYFSERCVPEALVKLKQGIGRLIRTHEDTGVIAILDTRLHTKNYGSIVRACLPPAPEVSHLSTVQAFFLQQEGQSNA
jgi:Rad3-related DNA helicase